MNITRIGDQTIDFDGVARVDKGPLLRYATASAALFEGEGPEGRSAEQVQIDTLGTKLKAHYQLGAFDKEGNLIVAGEQFAYLDWYGDHVYHYYERRTEQEPIEGGGTETIDRFHRMGWKATEAEAVAEATMIAQARAGD